MVCYESASRNAVHFSASTWAYPLAFDRDTHFCLGAPLGRLELAMVVGALVRPLPNLHLNETSAPQGDLMLFSRGCTRLIVVWDAQPSLAGDHA